MMMCQDLARHGHPMMAPSIAAGTAAAAAAAAPSVSVGSKNARTTTARASTDTDTSASAATTAMMAFTTSTSISTAATTAGAAIPAVNPIWRVKVTQWCYDYIDCIAERRTVVYLAMNILDRYCSCQVAVVDHTHYQVAALAATYLAIRIAGGSSSSNSNNKTNNNNKDLVAMSGGKISQGEIVAMGTKIVKALSWDARMETPTEWVHRYIDRCNKGVLADSIDNRHRLVEMANFMVEVAIFDVDFCDLAPRVLAAAAVLRVLSAHQVPAFVALLRADDAAVVIDPKVVQETSHRLGIFVKQSLRSTTSLAALSRPEELAAVHEAPAAAPAAHVIQDDDDLSLMRPGPCKAEQQTVYINGFALIPNDDDDAMDESY